MHPGVRRDIRRALDDLNAGKKRDTKALSDDLSGYYRLRIGKYRAIYSFDALTGELMIRFLKGRSTVYETFQPPQD
ncbi:cytotoxic translational repressor of toxin-antitoxin stability system [Opitutaceae bacterium TAV1]|nr:cytotoxic translational repressor of toxin-antitoxin stability system [Opitutaceae bacterium TAV1]